MASSSTHGLQALRPAGNFPVRSFPAARAVCLLTAAWIAVAGLFSSVAKADTVSLMTDRQDVSWKVKAVAEVTEDGTALSQPNFDTSDWLVAQVPGTVFGAAVNAGVEKDPNYGDNIYQVDKSKYNRDFWWRCEFTAPAAAPGRTTWLNFDGINKTGEIFLNGTRLGSLYGFMQRGVYNVTSLLRPGANVLAVKVTWPSETPIANFASPTYLSSGGWDWMPYVPGRLSGITDKVYLTTSGPVTVVDPWIRTHLVTNEDAQLSLAVDVSNSGNSDQSGKLAVTIEPGGIKVSKPVQVAAGQTTTVTVDSKDFPALEVKNPKLWWPNGYGDPDLYSCEVSFIPSAANSSESAGPSDTKKFNFGIREYTYDTDGDVLHIRVNGERVFVKGGNWGMSEYMLRCRGAEYDLKVALHRDMNMNMIRNWLGSTTDPEFYDACDKYGIMIWDEFWMNSGTGVPTDHEGLNNNVVEKIKRFRNHAAVAIWCGDNEGVPGPPMDDIFRDDVKTYDDNDRQYHSNSHAGALTGSGVWGNLDLTQYFTKYPPSFGGNHGWGFRTEAGTAVFTTFDSFKQFMPQDTWWPRNEMWNKHFFGKSAGNGSPDHYQETIDKRYGTATGIEDFCRKAQLLNIETNKAMYEGWVDHMWKDASGLMTWMSQSAYPSFVWQTYDYYYDLNGAFWGVKKACEPIHILWNCASNSIDVANSSNTDYEHLTAKAVVYDLDGNPVEGLSFSKTVDAPSDAATTCFSISSNPQNLAYKKPATASSTGTDGDGPNAVTDGDISSRWASATDDNQWIYVDLGKPQLISQVRLVWEAAHARSYDIEVSNDAQNWKSVYSTQDGPGGAEEITFPAVEARYVKMDGHQRATMWAFSIYEFEIYGADYKPSPNPIPENLHFLKLTLQNAAGKTISDNFYWCAAKNGSCEELNSLAKVDLNVATKSETEGDKIKLTTTITNPASSPAVAFAVHVAPVRAGDGSRILPVFMNDDYVTLLKGETKTVTMTFDASVLGQDTAKVLVEPYNNRSDSQ
jgi:beta-galactosidase/beta-glucuronidase